MGINYNINTGFACGTDSPLNRWNVERYSSCGKDEHHGCPDFVIRRHDTKPAFKVSVQECDGPMNLDGLVVEASMWSKAKLRNAIGTDDTYFRLADDKGFGQVTVGDVLLFDRPRQPEYMLVTGFDEDNHLIQVQRGYRGTIPGKWKKGTTLRLFRILGAVAEVELHFDDEKHPDGNIDRDKLQDAYLVYEWQPGDTCMSGHYFFEFKIIKMLEAVFYLPGGHWIGPVTQNDNQIYYTGSVINDSSVPLSYDSVHDRYLLPTTAFNGVKHQMSTNFYTGSSHTDGSVFLSRNDHAADVRMPFGGTAYLDAADSIRNLDAPLASNVRPAYAGYDNGGYPTSLHDAAVNGNLPYFQRGENSQDSGYGAQSIYGGNESDFSAFSFDESSDDSPWIDTYTPSCISVAPSFNTYSCVSTTSCASISPSFGNQPYLDCILGAGVEWIRRMPTTGEGFYIRIEDSFTREQ